ncbi:hypothetical protein APASM_3816 [Actinosynnema pretiosum subsp. pretiosum]|nr:hypothetical protein APASM_3816 [Actinosynnema pretiosum subsp. pretiosum]
MTPAETPQSGLSGALLFTPAQAAELLSVKESWLRRKAGERLVPCTFLGKHLRFSPTDLEFIALSGAQPVQPSGRPSTLG